MRRKHTDRNKGYTLVETLVAVSIFSVSILGLLVTLSQGIADTGYAKRKIAAAYLAQEGIEYVRNLRDTHMIYNSTSSQAGWNAFRDIMTTNCNRACYVNADNLNYSDATQPMLEISLPACTRAGRGGCPELRYDAATGRYNYTAGENSGFTREIIAERAGGTNPDEMKITSTVYWAQGSGSYSVSLTENLFNWIE